MSLQNEIDNLTDQIQHEQQSAATLEQDIANEQRTSAEKINNWQQQVQSHQAAATRMQQDLEAKQRQMVKEAEEEQRRAQKAAEQKDVAKRIAGGLL